MDQLMTCLTCLGRRLRLRDGWLLAQGSLWLAGLVALLIQFVGRIWPVSHLWLWSLAPLLGWLLAVPMWSWLRPMSLSRVARRCDAELGLKERLSTAVVLEGWKAGRLEGLSQFTNPPISQSTNLPIFQPSLVALQQQDALATARSIDPRHAFPLAWRRRPLLLAALLAAMVVALAVLPNRMDAVLAERAAVAQAAREEAAQIEKLRQEMEAATQSTPADREELLRELAELTKQLQANRGDREQALADMSKAEEALRQKLDPRADARQAALETLAAQLQTLAQERAGDQVDSSSPDQALQELAQQAAQMNAADRKALGQSLAQQAAEAAQAGESELAQALAAMAQAMQNGDSEAASHAAQEAAQALAQAQSDLASQSVLSRALSQVQASRQTVAQAGQLSGQAVAQGQSPGQGPGQSQGQGQGPGQNPGQGQAPGQNPRAGQGQPAGGGGTRADTLPPSRRSGQAGRPQGEGRPATTGALQSEVYVPWERRQAAGQELSLPGQDTGQGETQERQQRDPLPGAAGQALVPYRQVYYEYLDAANETLDQSYIPAGLKDYVRAYFSQLEP
jgi:hypothetical protein